jgi:AcrR family transcriptional regulator
MAPRRATSPLEAPPETVDAARLARADRREALLDVAAELVASEGLDPVSMESVAMAAHVSRGLVYKHFANRHDLLAALYERESRLLHHELAREVERAAGLEAMLGALVRGALRAQASRGATLAALTAEGGRGVSQRSVQRRRDAATLQHFTGVAVDELGLDPVDARTGVAIALGAIPTVLGRWRRHPTDENRVKLERVFVAMAMGGLMALARPAGPTRTP